MAGESQPPAVHAIAHAINDLLGNAGQTVTYLPTPEAVPGEQHAALRQLVVDMDAGRVQMLLIVGEANPVFSAPADLKFGEALQKVAWRAHAGLFYDETAELCQWHVPSTHYLEMWSDARSVDGTVSIVQPLLQPMYGGKSPHEVVATLSDRAERNGYDLVREYWMGVTAPAMAAAAAAAPRPAAPPPPPAGTPGEGAAPAPPPAAPTPASFFEKQWRKWLHDGYIADSAYAPAPGRAGLRLERQPGGGRGGHRGRDPLQARRVGLRRPLRQQRLAAGAAQAGDQAHLGQCGAAGARAPPSGWARRTAISSTVSHDGRLLELPAWIDPGTPRRP